MFALRHIKTGRFMPQTDSNRGYSHWNPDSPAVTPDAAIPGSIRLFPTAKGADHEMDRHPAPGAPCDYTGPGQTAQQREQDGQGFQLGSLERGTHSRHNGAGCYDSDLDFS